MQHKEIQHQTHLTEKDQILYTVYYSGIWILYLNKDKGVVSTGSSLKQRMWGMVLSYLALTTTRISHNVFVSFAKEVGEWYYFMRLNGTIL